MSISHLSLMFLELSSEEVTQKSKLLFHCGHSFVAAKSLWFDLSGRNVVRPLRVGPPCDYVPQLRSDKRQFNYFGQN